MDAFLTDDSNNCLFRNVSLFSLFHTSTVENKTSTDHDARKERNTPFSFDEEFSCKTKDATLDVSINVLSSMGFEGMHKIDPAATTPLLVVLCCCLHN